MTNSTDKLDPCTHLLNRTSIQNDRVEPIFEDTKKRNKAGVVNRRICPYCLAAYYALTIGEDGYEYLAPLKPRYCPFCGRRVP